MGICYSESPTLPGPPDSTQYHESPRSPQDDHEIGSPLRASVHCLLSKEFETDKSDRQTIIGGSLEGQSRLCGLFGYKSIKGTKYNSPNQDDFFVVQDVDFSLYGVLDGHGPYGHKVSNYVESKLPDCIITHPDFLTNPKIAISNAFKTIEAGLSSHTSSYIHAEQSGTTATVVLQLSDKLYIAHVGDSKAVVLTHIDGKLEVTYSTLDHKPDRSDEARRINELGGEIRSQGSDSPLRFFQRGTNMPGLAVSRTLGDTNYQPYGLSYEPEIAELDLTPATRYVVVATDGVWEYIKPEFAARMLNNVKDVHVAAERLVKKALDCWMFIDKTTSDDITAVVSAIPSKLSCLDLKAL